MEAQAPEQSPNRTLRLVLALALGGAIVLLAAGYWVFGRSVEAREVGDPRPVLAAANCVLSTYPLQVVAHVAKLAPGYKHNSFPATSGAHFPTAANWGVYTTSVEQFVAVHNLEHGGIAVEVGDKVPANFGGALIETIKDDPNGMLFFPLPALEKKVAFVAWRRAAICSAPFDIVKLTQALEIFRDAYRFRGPEKLPLFAMEPQDN